MSVIRNILRSYPRPRAVMRDLLQAGQREDRALAMIMGTAVLLFVAQWPWHARQAHIHGDDLTRLLATDVYGLIFFFPLLMYGLAALSRVIARLLGGQGTWYSARLTLFWAWLASSPLILISGVVKGMLGQGGAYSIVGLLWFIAFLWIWINGIIATEKGPADV